MLRSVHSEAVLLLHRMHFYTQLTRDRHCNIKYIKGTETFTEPVKVNLGLKYRVATEEN